MQTLEKKLQHSGRKLIIKPQITPSVSLNITPAIRITPAANKNVNPDKIIELMNKQDLIFIDRYDNLLLANDIRLCGKNDGTIIDRIELNDDNAECKEIPPD